MSEHPDCDLTAGEERTWDAATLAFRLLDQQVERELQETAALPLTYYELLVMLSREPEGSLRMSELARRTSTKPTRISHAVRKLTEAGLVERVHCTHDRRSWFAGLTDEGWATLRKAGPRHVASMREHLLDVLTPEQLAQLRDISDSLLRHLAPERER